MLFYEKARPAYLFPWLRDSLELATMHISSATPFQNETVVNLPHSKRGSLKYVSPRRLCLPILFYEKARPAYLFPWLQESLKLATQCT